MSMSDQAAEAQAQMVRMWAIDHAVGLTPRKIPIGGPAETPEEHAARIVAVAVVLGAHVTGQTVTVPCAPPRVLVEGRCV